MFSIYPIWYLSYFTLVNNILYFVFFEIPLADAFRRINEI